MNKVAIFGLGNVGLVAAISYAELGFEVTGIEVIDEKVQSLKNNILYFQENDLNELFIKNRSRLNFHTDYLEAKHCSTILVCVGTPPRINGAVDLSQIQSTLEQVCEVINESDKFKTLVIKSTIPPETTRKKLLPLIQEKTGKECNKDFHVLFHPEFLREGQAVHDFLNPNLHVIGTNNGEKPNDDALTFLNKADKTLFVSYEEAEMIKYLNNSFHALKITFANEIGSIAQKYSVNIEKLFEAFFADTKLNISSNYLLPGFSFGGPCLKKEVTALEHLARQKDLITPLISSIIDSNNGHTDRFLQTIEDQSFKKVLFLGASFKPGTSDIRESPVVYIISKLNSLPSYLKKIIHLCDYQEVTKSISHIVDCGFNNLDQCEDEYDLIILGPYKDENVFKKYPNSNYLNLGFHNYKNEKVRFIK